MTAASVFTGYDTASHIAEEATEAHNAVPFAMIYAVLNCLCLGIFLIIGMSLCIKDIESLTNMNEDGDKQGFQFAYIQYYIIEITIYAYITYTYYK